MYDCHFSPSLSQIFYKFSERICLKILHSKFPTTSVHYQFLFYNADRHAVVTVLKAHLSIFAVDELFNTYLLIRSRLAYTFLPWRNAYISHFKCNPPTAVAWGPWLLYVCSEENWSAMHNRRTKCWYSFDISHLEFRKFEKLLTKLFESFLYISRLDFRTLFREDCELWIDCGKAIVRPGSHRARLGYGR